MTRIRMPALKLWVILALTTHCGVIQAEAQALDLNDITIFALLFQTPIDGSEGMQNPALVVWRIKDKSLFGNLHYEAALKGNELYFLLKPSLSSLISWQVRPVANILVADGAPAQYDHGALMKQDRYFASFVGIELEGSLHYRNFFLRPQCVPIIIFTMRGLTLVMISSFPSITGLPF